jgi:hypothetical protein
MKEIIRTYALRLKDDCEDWGSPVPRCLRMALHEWGKRLYCATYGLTPASVESALAGADVDPVTIIYANRCMKDYGATLKRDGGQTWHIHISEHALLAMIGFESVGRSWQRMCEINGIHIKSLGWQEDSDDTAERYDLPKGTRFYYREPDEPEEE